MKNTNIINKYTSVFGILLLAVVFSVAMPFAVKADDVTTYPDYSYSTYPDYSNTTYPDYSYSTYPDYSYNTSQVSSGGFTGGGINYDYSTGYYYPGSVVSTGGFSGGTIYQNVPAAVSYPGSVVSSGSFNGGTQYYGYGYNNGYNYGQLTASCSSSFNTGVQNGPQVTWTGAASGGNGIYNYYWTGDEGMVANGQYVSKTYLTNGVKNAYLTITSGDGQTARATCSATVGNGNQVLAYSATNPALQSVYLSNVPYTGAGDVAKVVGFLSMLLLWSAGLSYIFLKRKEKMENPVFASVEMETRPQADPLKSFSMDINSDKQAIESIETYARMNQVLLSSDAVRELAKLARLKKGNPKEMIKKMSTGEWTTIGENDIQKYL